MDVAFLPATVHERREKGVIIAGSELIKYSVSVRPDQATKGASFELVQS